MNLPNLITLLRLQLVPVTIWLILKGNFLGAFAAFAVAGISDALDGFLARRLNQRTRIGELLDPLADKALLVSIYVTLGIAGELPDWLVILVVFRDVMIVGGFLFIEYLGYHVERRPLLLSKINTALQILLAGFTLAKLGLLFEDYGAGQALIRLVGITTLASGGAYMLRPARILRGGERQGAGKVSGQGAGTEKK